MSACDQLKCYNDAHPEGSKLTNEYGAPMETKTATMSLGPRGPLLLEDNNFIEDMAHFDRERIPERVVHAKGAGAFGYFECTHDVTKYTKLAPFAQIGKKTDMSVRFSTVGGESGSADTARDPRGFAMKFYTEEGNWDLVGNNTPIFFIRDPILFPSFIHTQKRNPRTHLKDPDMFWDFISLRPETTHQVMFLFSNRGTPDGYRKMNGYGSHTFKLVNKDNDFVWCKFHFKTDQKIHNLSAKEAGEMQGKNPDYAIEDLYNSIANGDFPSWSCFLQVMTNEQSEKETTNPFDLTKVWPHDKYPLIPVGKMVLNRNPTNYFNDVEQSAYSPAHMVPGVEASPDKMLQGRLFSYGDTHRHRLGTNYNQIPVNKPRCPIRNYQRDGPQNFDNQGDAPNYFPNSFSGPQEQREYANLGQKFEGIEGRYQTSDEDNFSQPGVFWSKVLDDKEKADLVANIAGHLKDAKKFLQERVINNFTQVNGDFGQRLREAVNAYKPSNL